MRLKAVVIVAAVGSIVGLYLGIGPRELPAAEPGGATRSNALEVSPHVPVLLAGFGRRAECSVEGTHPVLWNSDAYPWIANAGECRALWDSRPACADPKWEGGSLRRDFDDQNPIEVRTCAEWVAGLRSGRSAMTTYDISQESFFIDMDGTLSAIAHAQPSWRSAWCKFDLQALAYELLPPPVDRDAISRAQDPELAWYIVGNQIIREDESCEEWIEPVAFGDIDGDGWEDMIANCAYYARHGTMRSYEMRAFTRREDDRLIEISIRLPALMPSDADRRRAVDAWTANYGLPEGDLIQMSGRCGCGDAEHDMRMSVRSIGGIMEGEYQCARTPKSLRINGCLAGSSAGNDAKVTGRGQLTEFGIDEAPTAQLRFDWSITGGKITFTGHRDGSGQMETDEFTVAGRVR